MSIRALTAAAVASVLLPSGCGSDDRSGAAQPVAEPRVSVDARGPVAKIPNVVARVQPSVVAVLIGGPRGSGEGSGVVWDESGLVVTNHHVVAGAETISVALASGERVSARLRASDELTDLAVLDLVRSGLPAADFARDVPRLGEFVIAIGNPLSLEGSVTAGIVSGLHRSIPSGGRTPALVDLLQTDAAISPGNSGGALVNERGEIVGINVAYIPPAPQAVAIGFAIPAPTVLDVVEELLADGSVEHAFLGVRLAPLTATIREPFELDAREGALVLSVDPGAAAARARIRPGDVIVRLAEEPVRTVADVYAILRQSEPGEHVGVTVVRDGERRALRATLAERPEG